MRQKNPILIGNMATPCNAILTRLSGSLALQVGDHFEESTTGTVRCIGQTKIFEDLQKSLLLIKESEVFPGAIGLAEKALADDRQSPIAELRPERTSANRGL